MHTKLSQKTKLSLIKKNSQTAALLAFTIIICIFSASLHAGSVSKELLSDSFDGVSGNWQDIYLEGDSGSRYSIKSGSLKINVEGKSRYGIYHTVPIRGHFYVDAEFDEDDNVALALLQEKNGKPDPENFTMLTVEKNADGIVVVSVRDRQNEKEDVLDNTGLLKKTNERRRGRFESPDAYRHILTGKQYSVPFDKTNKKIRIFHDGPAGFFHFYYAVKQIIHGEDASGWMEIAPSKDWAEDGQQYYVALIANSEGNAVFKNVKAVQKPTMDRDDRKTGFRAIRRDYNWSGCFGDGVVVSFDDEFAYHHKDIKFVFWSEMNYVPAWHVNNQLLYTYEFVETWGGGNPGCHEPMSDRLLRWSNVEIIEDNAVRKVVHWHYVLCDPDYKVPYDSIGTQIPEVDEFWTFYPDGSGTRYIRYTPKLDINIIPEQPHELAEMIAIAGSSTNTIEHYDSPALTFTNLEGKTILSHPGAKFDYDSEINDWPQQITVLHFKNQPDFYSVFSVDERFPDTYSGYKIKYQNTWHNIAQKAVHWPVNKRPYTRAFGSTGTWKEEVTHSCLVSIDVKDGVDWSDNYKIDSRGRKYRDWIMFFGAEEKNQLGSIRDRVRSWLPTCEIKILNDNCKFEMVDHREKAFVIKSAPKAEECNFNLILKGENSILINPCSVENL